jgi:predicted methyltransferase
VLRRAVVLALLLCAPAFAAENMDAATERALKASLSASYRTQRNVSLDGARHPLETLRFFGVKRDAAMMEIWPQDAWWTEFLGPIVAEKGRYVVALDDLTGLDTPLSDRIHALALVYPFNFGKIEFAPFGPPLLMHPVAAESLDFAFCFDALRHALATGTERNMLGGAFGALKPGGMLGVVEGRTPRLSEADVIALVERAGFKLAARSEINASEINAKAAGGELARSTLLFQKPGK